MASVVENGNEALDEIEQNAKPDSTKIATLWWMIKLGKLGSKIN